MSAEKKRRVAKPQKPENADKLFPLLLASDDSESLLSAGKIALELVYTKTRDDQKGLEEIIESASSTWKSEETSKAFDEIRQLGRDLIRIHYGFIPVYRVGIHDAGGVKKSKEIETIIEGVQIKSSIGNGNILVSLFFTDPMPKSGWVGDENSIIPGKHYATNEDEALKVFLSQLKRAFLYYLASEWNQLKFFIGACPRCGKVFEKKRGDQEYCSELCRKAAGMQRIRQK